MFHDHQILILAMLVLSVSVLLGKQQREAGTVVLEGCIEDEIPASNDDPCHTYTSVIMYFKIENVLSCTSLSHVFTGKILPSTKRSKPYVHC